MREIAIQPCACFIYHMLFIVLASFRFVLKQGVVEVYLCGYLR